jgi:superoxide oxidase
MSIATSNAIGPIPADPAPIKYRLLARAFHWGIALLMAGMFISIWIRSFTERDSPERAFWMGVHTSLGILVFGLTVLRLITRRAPPPPLEHGLTHAAAVAMHWLLMLATLLVPLTGFVRVIARGRDVNFFGLAIPSLTGDAPDVYNVARALHGGLMEYTVLALIALHAAAALWHHVVLKDATLRRML